MFKPSKLFDTEAEYTLNQTTGISLNHICAVCGWTFGEHFSVHEQKCPTEVPTYETSISQRSMQAFEHRFLKYYQRLSINKEI